jgi:hypothetical protein
MLPACMTYGVAPQRRALSKNLWGNTALTSFITLYAREGADGQAVVCPLLRGSSPTGGLSQQPFYHQNYKRGIAAVVA